jgi:hypothetical protein
MTNTKIYSANQIITSSKTRKKFNIKSNDIFKLGELKDGGEL